MGEAPLVALQLQHNLGARGDAARLVRVRVRVRVGIRVRVRIRVRLRLGLRLRLRVRAGVTGP